MAATERMLPESWESRRWARTLGRSLGAVAAAVLGALLFVPGPDLIIDGALSMLGCGALVGAFLARQWAGYGCPRIIDSPPLRWLGRRSYSFYLVHVIVLKVILDVVHLHASEHGLPSCSSARSRCWPAPWRPGWATRRWRPPSCACADPGVGHPSGSDANIIEWFRAQLMPAVGPVAGARKAAGTPAGHVGGAAEPITNRRLRGPGAWVWIAVQPSVPSLRHARPAVNCQKVL